MKSANTIAVSSINRLPDLSGAENPAELLSVVQPFLQRCTSLNHDMNNPLTGILGYGELLLDDPEDLSPDQRDYVSKIMECAERISGMIQHLGTDKREMVEKLELAGLRKEFPEGQ